MADMSVTITNGDYLDPKGNPIPGDKNMAIHRDPRAVIQGEYANWKFHSDHPDVQWLRVIFDNDQAKMFPRGANYTHFHDKKYEDGVVIWARPASSPVSQAREKYTLLALTRRPPADGSDPADDTIVGRKDPQLIVDRP